MTRESESELETHDFLERVLDRELQACFVARSQLASLGLHIRRGVYRADCVDNVFSIAYPVQLALRWVA
mgnify:CR=1 FL=1